MGKQRNRPNPDHRFTNDPKTAQKRRGPKASFTTPNQLVQSQNTYRSNINTQPGAIAPSPFSSDYFNPKFLGFDLGNVDDSAYNPLSINDPYNSNIDFEAIRAEKQSTISKLGSTGIQFLSKTGVGTVGNIIGGFYGLGKAAASGETTPLWDNEVYRSLDEFQESVEAKNSVFLNRKEGFGFNMSTFKDVADAYAFIASAAISETVMQMAGNAMGGLGAATLPARMARYFNRANKIVKMLDKADDVERLAMNLNTTVEKLANYKRSVDMISATGEMGRKMLTTTAYEAGLEARGVKDEFLANAERDVNKIIKNDPTMSDEEKERYKREYMEKAMGMANSAGLVTFGLNTAVLHASNIIQFPSIFGSSYFKAKKVSNLERGALGKVSKKSAGKVQRGVSTIGRVLKNPATEFMEETLQGVSAESSKHYYQNILETETNGGVLAPLASRFSDSMWHGLKETYGTEEGLYEGVIGAIVGGIGLPGFKKVANKSRLSWNGGIYGSIKELVKEKRNTETLIDNLNSVGVSDAMKYKRDNAILSTLDADKEDHAINNDDKFTFDAIQDNKVFRYTMDRLKNGLDNFISEDISELSRMDLDKYKETFGKDEGFTEQDKQKEIDDFKKKTDIYTKAFKTAHKVISVNDYHYDPISTNKLADILVHSLATEKIYNERLEELKQKIFSVQTEELTPEEINEFVESAGKLIPAKAILESYINSKNRNKKQEFDKELKEQLDPEYQWLLDLDSIMLTQQLQMLEDANARNNPLNKETSESLEKQKKNIEKAIELRQKEQPSFSDKKSSKARGMREDLEKLTKEINDILQADVPRAMKALGQMPKKVTQKELEKYLDFRPKLSKALNDKHKTTAMLDRIETQETDDMLNEIANITKELTTAVEIAASLYKVKDNPKRMYAKVQIGELYANIDNAKRQALSLHYLLMTTRNMDLINSAVEELKDSLDIIVKMNKKYSNLLNKKGQEYVKEQIKGIKDTLKLVKKFTADEKALKKQDEDAQVKKPSDATDEELNDLLKNSGVTMEKEEDDESDDRKKEIVLDKSINRINLKEHKVDGTPALQNEGYDTLEELIADGKIKDKAAVTLTINEDEVLPENNPVLAKILKKEGLTESYLLGKEQVERNPDSLKEPKGNVLTFLRYMPVSINIYDKKATKVDNHYDFEIDKDDKIIYQQYLFAATPNEKEAEDRSYRTNIEYRKALLLNKLNENNELKLKVHNVNLGDFYKPEEGAVQERNVSELGYDARNIDPNMIMYSTTNRKEEQKSPLSTITGDAVNDISGHPLQGATVGNASHLYFGYENSTGKVVPIKMNLKKLDSEDVDLIVEELKKFLVAKDKDAYSIQIPKEKNAILHSKGPIKMDTGRMSFLSFFLKRKRGGKGNPLFLNNTYSLITKGAKGLVKFELQLGGIKSFKIEVPVADGTNTQEILDIFNEKERELRQELLTQRHNFNTAFFTNPKEKDRKEEVLDRDALDIAFKTKLINHTFDVNGEDTFDKVYDSDFNKFVTLSRADVDDVASEAIKPLTWHSAIKQFRGLLANKNDETEVSLNDMYYAIERGIRNSLSIKLGHRDIESMSRKEKDEMVRESIETIVNKRIEMARELGQQFPGKLSNIDHESNTRIKKSDTVLDEFVKNLYQFKNVALQDKEYRKQLINRMDHWNALSSLMNQFRKPPAGANFRMMSFGTNSKGTRVVNNITSPEQLDSLMRIIHVIKDLVSIESIPYLDLNYSETYPAANGKEFTNKYVNPKGLKDKQLTNKHHKTRLKSVQIVEEPRWDPKTGELVAGEVYFNFGSKGKSGKVGNQKVLVLSKDMTLEKSTNIMTSISLPFISPSTMELSDRFDEMVNAVQDNLAEDITARNIALGHFKQAKRVKKGVVEDWIIEEDDKDDEVDKETTEDQSLEDYVKEGLDKDNISEKEDTTPVVKPKKVLNTKNLQNKVVRTLFKLNVNQLFGPLTETEDGVPDNHLKSLKEKFNKVGITNLTEYIFALEYLANEEGIVENNEANIKLGELIFEEKEKIVSNICDFNLEGKLHRKLKEKYPETVIDGVSSYYLYIRQNEDFLEDFGDWTSEEMQDILLETGILNEQGEPQLYIDSKGPYVLSPGKDFIEGRSKVITGEPHYLNDTTIILTSTEYSNGINTIAGEFIRNNENKNVNVFVEEYLESRIVELTKKNISLEGELSKTKNTDESVDILEQIENNYEIVEKLSSILESKGVLNTFITRVDNRIGNQNFKITAIEDTGDIEDGDTHSDIINFTIDANEVSNRAGADVEILKFLSSIPRFVPNSYDSNINKQKKLKNSLFGGDIFMNQGAVWGIIENIVADIIVNDANENLFDSYLKALRFEVLLSEHPELNYIYNFLNNLEDNVKDPENFKIKFKKAMHKSSINYVYTLVDLDKKANNLSLKVIDPSLTHSKEGKITDNFIETIINIEGRTEKELAKIKSQALDAFNKIKNSEDYLKYTDFLTDLLVDKLGLSLEALTIKRLVLNESNESFTNLNKLINQFLTKDILDGTLPPLDFEGEFDILLQLLSRSKKGKEEYKAYLMRPNSFLKKLGKYESIYKNRASEATVYIGGKQRWLYSFVPQMEMELKKMKRSINTRFENLKNRGFKYIEFMLNNPNDAQNIKLITNTELKTKNDPNPVQHKEITRLDFHLEQLIKMFHSKVDFIGDTTMKKQGKGSAELQRVAAMKNYLIYNFAADKNSLFALSGLPMPFEGTSGDIKTKKGLGEDFKKILRGYVLGEFRRMEEDSKVVEEYMEDPNVEHLMENLIPDYHYKVVDKNKNIENEDTPLTAQDFQAGQYYKLGVFTSAFDKYLENNFVKVFGEEKGKNTIPLVRNSFFESRDGKNSDFDTLMEIVYAEINEFMEEDYAVLNNMTLLNSENAEGEIEHKKLFDVNLNVDFGGNKEQLAYSYIASSFIIAYELSNIFNGHISYYKQKDNETINLDDFLKRGSAPGSTGTYLYTDRKDKTKKTYTTYSGKVIPIVANKNTVVAVVNNIESKKSKFASLISKTLGVDLDYAHEIADAQGASTPEHFKDIISRIDGWTEEDQTNFEELSNPEHVVTNNNINWIKNKNKVFTPKKLTYFGITDNNMPIFLKYSIAPLFPALVGNNQGKRILDQMKKQGVEQIVFKSGSKGSNFTPTTIHTTKNDIFTGISEDFKFNPFLIDSEYLKLQTEIPTNLNKPTKLGNQVIKNILVNLDTISTEKNYLFQGKMLTGAEIYREVEDSIKNILQTQLTQVLGNLGYDKINEKFNVVNIKKFLKRQMDVETEVDILNLLDTELPLETIPNFAQRAFPVISKYIDKQAGTVYTNGASVVQVANIGFDRVIDKKAKEGIFFFDNSNRELTPPIPKTYADLTKNEKRQISEKVEPDTIIYWNKKGEITLNPEEGKMRIKKAKILLPFSDIFKNTDLSYEVFIEMYKNKQIDEEIFKNIIGYRIPNQAVASIDSFEIIGLLPPIAGDQAVVYNEITAKTGSDFDIDKMYLMMPIFKTLGREYVIPEENQELLKKLEKELKGKYPKLKNYLTVDWLKDKNGEDIMNALLLDPDLKDYYDSLDTASENKPRIKFILDNYDDAKEILKKNGITIANDDGSRLPLITILVDTMAAHIKRNDERNEFYKEKKARIRQIEEEYGWKRPKKIVYVNGKSNKYIDNSKNRLIELYASILESEATYDDLMSPLDNPIIKDTIFNVIHNKELAMGITDIPNNEKGHEEWLKTKDKNALKQLFPVELVNARVDVIEAKALISVMANNMTDLGESQKVGLKLKYDIGFNSKDLGRIYMLDEDSKSQKISKYMSYGMNAAVDAAKDAYIIKGNFNTYTANAGIMLLRMGVDLDSIFTILTNETILNFSESKVDARAKTTNIITEHSAKQLDGYAKTVANRLSAGETIFDIVSKKQFLANDADSKNNILGIWHLLQEVGKEFNNSVVAMKSDSNGPGKNISEMIALGNRVERMLEDSIENSEYKWFRNGIRNNRKFNPNIQDNPNAKMLGVFANNTLFLMEAISEQIFIEATPKVKETINLMAGALGNPLPTDANTIKLLNNYLYPYLLYRTGHPLYKMNKEYKQKGALPLTEAEWLINEFPTVLQKKKQTGKYAFLNELIVSTRSKENVIKFLNSERRTPEEILKFKESLIELANDDREFMDNLVKYSYVTTGFKPTPFSFHQFFPANYFINNAHGMYIKAFIENKNEIIDPSLALTLIALNNHNNYKIVVNKPGNLSMPLTGDRPITNEKLLEKLEINNPLGEKAYKPFIKRKSRYGPNLYNLIDITDEGLPIYAKNSDINDTSTFKIYDYSNVSTDLYLNEVYYTSKVKQLYGDIAEYTEQINREDYGLENQKIDSIFAESGKSIRSLGYIQESWDELSEKVKNEIIKCN